MTEAEWLAAPSSAHIQELLRGKADERRYRLFACACARRVWHLLPDERCRRAVETAERYAEGLKSFAALLAARDDAYRVAVDLRAARRVADYPIRAATYAAWNTADEPHDTGGLNVAVAASWNAASALAPVPFGVS